MDDLIRQLWNLSGQLGPSVIFPLLFALVGVYFGWWVPKYLYEAKCKECDEWRRLAWAGRATAKDATEVAKL